MTQGENEPAAGMDPDIDAVWEAEVQRRIERIRSGDVEWFDADLVLAELESDP